MRFAHPLRRWLLSSLALASLAAPACAGTLTVTAGSSGVSVGGTVGVTTGTPAIPSPTPSTTTTTTTTTIVPVAPPGTTIIFGPIPTGPVPTITFGAPLPVDPSAKAEEDRQREKKKEAEKEAEKEPASTDYETPYILCNEVTAAMKIDEAARSKDDERIRAVLGLAGMSGDCTRTPAGLRIVVTARDRKAGYAEVAVYDGPDLKGPAYVPLAYLVRR